VEKPKKRENQHLTGLQKNLFNFWFLVREMETVALIASFVSIGLAFFAIWQANHHRDQSDKLNRDTTEKLTRIEVFATSIKEDAFGEIKRYGDFWRAGGKVSEEAEKAKEEEIKKLKDEIQATTSAEINKVLQTVESKLSSSTQASTISEIKKEFEELKKEVTRIQEKGLGEVKRIENEEKFKRFWHSLAVKQKDLLVKAVKNPFISDDEIKEAGISGYDEFGRFVRALFSAGAVSAIFRNESNTGYQMKLRPEFRQFLELVK
jgi:hypothetical protein